MNVEVFVKLWYMKAVIMTWWRDTGDVLRSCDYDLVTWHRWCAEKLWLWIGDVTQVMCWEAVIMIRWRDTGDVLRSCDYDLVTWHRWCAEKLWYMIGQVPRYVLQKVQGTYRLVRITGSAVRTREPITIHSASASVMFSGAESEITT